MPYWKTQRTNGIQRHRVTRQRECSLGVISFDTLERVDCQAKIVDLSVIGIGIESPQSIPPGIIWFRKCVSGQRCGTLVWCKQIGASYRAGIQFISLSREEEEYINRQLELSRPNEPLPDPDRIMSRLINGIRREHAHSPEATPQ